MENCFKIAVIGVGIMGSRYALQLQEGRIEGACLAALTRVKSPYREQLLPSIESGVPVYPDGAALLSAVERGELALDGVIIATPHFDHQAQAVHAFRAGLAVLTDKPLGVHLGQGLAMIAAARESGKPFGAMFQQRTNPLYQQIREIIQSKKYGELKRVNWVVTDWYRPDSYYTSAPWRATWATDGGGVLLESAMENYILNALGGTAGSEYAQPQGRIEIIK